MTIRHLFILLLLPVLATAQESEADRIIRVVSDQLQDMRQELAQMRQVLEKQEDKISRLERRLNQNYIELDRRLRTEGGQAPDTPVDSGIVPSSGSAGSFRARLQAAQGFIDSGQLSSALNTLSELVLSEPEDADAPLAWYWLGEMYLQLEQYEDAEQAFSYLIAVHESHWRIPAAAFKLGEVYRFRGEKAKARIQYSRVVERYPDSPAARLSALALDSMHAGNQ